MIEEKIKNEQLQEVIVDSSLAESVDPKVEEKVELKVVEPEVELKVEEKVEEPEVEPKVEEPEVEPKVVDLVVEDNIQEDIVATKEELSVIKEVRDELVTLYARYQSVNNLSEQLSSELKTIKLEKEQLTSELERYKIAEATITAQLRKEQLSKLSDKFKLLGQEKTIEQLAVKDDETLREFEKIVDAALDKTAEVAERPSVTANSQASESLSDVEDKPKVEVEVKTDTKDTQSFFVGVCNKL